MSFKKIKHEQKAEKETYNIKRMFSVEITKIRYISE